MKTNPYLTYYLTLHDLWDLTPHSHGFSNNSYPIPGTDSCFLRYSLILSSHLRLRLTRGPFPVGLQVELLKEPLPPFI